MFSSRAFQGAQGKTPTEARSLLDTQPTRTSVPSGRPRRPVPGSRILGFWDSRKLPAASRRPVPDSGILGFWESRGGISGAALPQPGSRGGFSRESGRAATPRAENPTPESENPRIRDPGTGRAAPGPPASRVRPPSPAARDKKDSVRKDDSIHHNPPTNKTGEPTWHTESTASSPQNK